MALERNLSGFEIGTATTGFSGNGVFTNDGTARTGCFYIPTTLRTAGGGLIGLTVTPISLTAGQTFVGVWRTHLRLTVAPNQNGACFLLLGTPTTLWYTVRINIDRTWELWTSGTGATTGGLAIPLNTWVEVSATITFIRNTGSLAGSVTVNGQTLSSSIVAGGFIGAAGNFNRIEMGSNPSFNGAAGLTAGAMDWDDVVMILTSTPDTGSATLPASTRIRAVPIIAQGASAGWTGSFANIQDIPPVASTGQTSAGAGLVTTFTHQTATQLGIGSIDAIKLYGACTRAAGSSTEHIRWNGVDTAVTVTTSIAASPYVVSWGSLATATFDAAEFGMVNSTGGSLSLWGMLGEVLYTANAQDWFVCAGVTAPFTNAPGSGDGGCLAIMGPGTDSAGGSGCKTIIGPGSDSGGGAGCLASL